MSKNLIIDKAKLQEIPRTYIESIGSVTFKEEDVREVAESLLMRSIFGLIELDGFEPSVEWIQPRLNWADTNEVNYALKRLNEFGMLIQADGKYLCVNINFDDYLSQPESLSAQYLFSTELGQLIHKYPKIINTQATGVYLWNESIYRKFAHGIEILINQANMEARNSQGKDMLVAFDFSMTEVTRAVSAETKDQGE